MADFEVPSARDWNKLEIALSCNGHRISWLDCRTCGLRFRILASYDFSVNYRCPVCPSEDVVAHVDRGS